MGFTVKIVCDSISKAGHRITTMALRYPRFIHSEFMTHRVFSRNASSSRAIPLKKQIENILKDTAYPIDFRKNQKGMQAGEPVEDQEKCYRLWDEARDAAIAVAEKMGDLGVHKQYSNRILEPFSHIDVVVTSTFWDNFFALRCHKDAQPEFKVLAEFMRTELNNSTPVLKKEGEFHLPFITEKDNHLDLGQQIKTSVARCARVSYLNHFGENTAVEEDLRLYNQLVGSEPKHSSPAEHQAEPDKHGNMYYNLYGWTSLRWALDHKE